VLLTWPSDPRETFLVLARSNASPETQWTVLTNHLPASTLTTSTTFLDRGGAARPQAGQPKPNLRDLYCVLLIPDFWTSPDGANLDGGPQHCGADFIPIYTGTSEIDPYNRPFVLHVEMLVDSERASEEEAIDLRAAVDDGVERVNLGTGKGPRWAYATGFWLQHDQLTNGLHTLQLRTLLRLNTLVGPGEQFLTITNPSARLLATKYPAGQAGGKAASQSKADQSWWSHRLGSDFRRKTPPGQTENQPSPEAVPKAQLIARPLDLAASSDKSDKNLLPARPPVLSAARVNNDPVNVAGESWPRANSRSAYKRNNAVCFIDSIHRQVILVCCVKVTGRRVHGHKSRGRQVPPREHLPLPGFGQYL
jgi:hypothetical protein